MNTLSEPCDQDVREIVRGYCRRGWMPIPVPSGLKGPATRQWQQLRVKESDVNDIFAPNNNVGVLLGEPSGDLIDVDLDSREAVLLARTFLPKTDAIFGRPSKQASHFLYR